MNRLLLAALCLVLMLPYGATAQAQGQILPVGAWVTLRPPGQGFTMRMPPDWEQTSPTLQASNTKLVIRSTRAASGSRVGVATCNVTVDAQPETGNKAQASINAQIQAGPLNRGQALVLFESLSSPQIGVVA